MLSQGKCLGIETQPDHFSRSLKDLQPVFEPCASALQVDIENLAGVMLVEMGDKFAQRPGLAQPDGPLSFLRFPCAIFAEFIVVVVVVIVGSTTTGIPVIMVVGIITTAAAAVSPASTASAPTASTAAVAAVVAGISIAHREGESQSQYHHEQ